MMTTGEVNASNLQVITIDITLMKRYDSVACYFLMTTTSLTIIGAGNHGTGGLIGEADGAVLCVVDGCPNAGLGLDARLVTVSVEDGREAEFRFFLRARDVRILVQLVSLVEGVISCLHRHAAIAHVVVIIAVGFTIHLRTSELGARVVYEAIVHSLPIAGCVALSK